jgi:AraC-like DNA-binding protein
VRRDTADSYGEIAESLMAWLRENYKRNDVSLDDFVATTSFSRSHVQRALKHHGKSWRDELISMRMQEGARLLKANLALPVGTIAEEVGYSQAAQFSRVFRERWGKSPLEYRNGGDN